MFNLTQKISKNRQIVIANQINESRFKMSRAEQKLILYCIAMIDNKEGRLGLTFEMSVQDFVDFLEIKCNDYYQRILDITEDFAGKIFEIKQTNGEIHRIPALSIIKYKKGSIELKINPELAPYLLDLKSKFTKYSLQEVLSFKSGFSMRIYQLLSQYQYKQEVEYTVEQLRFCLNINDDKFERFFDFKRFVLDIAQKEIAEKSSLKFEYKLIKKGQKVVIIKFIITQAIKPDLGLFKNLGNQSTILEDIQDEIEIIRQPNPLQIKLEKLGFGENQIDKLLADPEPQKVLDCTDYVTFKLEQEIEKGKTKNKIQSPTGYFFTIYNAYEDIDFSGLKDLRAKQAKIEQEKIDYERRQKEEEEEEQIQAKLSKLKQEKIAKYKQENLIEVEEICVEVLARLQTENKTFILEQVKNTAKKQSISLIESVKIHLLTKYEIDNKIWEKIEGVEA